MVSASGDDDSCFVAFVTDLNLQRDALYLPKDFSDSNGLQRECSKIVVMDGDEKLWVLDLMFNESSGEFYISQGWRSFCDGYRKKAGSHFVFKLVSKGEIPLFSFYPAESRGETASKKESLPKEPGSGKRISKDSVQPSENRFVTLRLSQYSLEKSRQYLSLRFMRENGMDKSGIVNILGKEGKTWIVGLQLEGTKQMRLTQGWTSFAIANGFKTGDSLTLVAIWDNETPTLSLTMEANHNREEMRETLLASQNRMVTLKLTLEDVETSQFILPSEFMKANGINRLGTLIFFAKSKEEHIGALLSKELGTVVVGCGWKKFCGEHGVEIGDSFTLTFINVNEQDSLVFEFSPKL